VANLQAEGFFEALRINGNQLTAAQFQVKRKGWGVLTLDRQQRLRVPMWTTRAVVGHHTCCLRTVRHVATPASPTPPVPDLLAGVVLSDARARPARLLLLLVHALCALRALCDARPVRSLLKSPVQNL